MLYSYWDRLYSYASRCVCVCVEGNQINEISVWCSEWGLLNVRIIAAKRGGLEEKEGNLMLKFMAPDLHVLMQNFSHLILRIPFCVVLCCVVLCLLETIHSNTNAEESEESEKKRKKRTDWLMTLSVYAPDMSPVISFSSLSLSLYLPHTNHQNKERKIKLTLLSEQRRI